jgi:hypothetical protein
MFDEHTGTNVYMIAIDINISYIIYIHEEFGLCLHTRAEVQLKYIRICDYKCTKDCNCTEDTDCLLYILLNYSMTAEVLVHCFRFVRDLIVLLILSKICLLILHIGTCLLGFCTVNKSAFLLIFKIVLVVLQRDKCLVFCRGLDLVTNGEFIGD